MKNGIINILIASTLVVLTTMGSTQVSKHKPDLPNILFIYADDLGYGDVSAYNKQSKISTPNIDLLAQEGVSFMDAHSPAAICAPSRYSLLTGRYAWRSPKGTELGHPYSECKIEKDRPTIASVLKMNGYNTAQIGKWGLRSDYREALKDPSLPIDSISPSSFDFTKPIYGANKRGFDYCFTLLMLAGKRDGKYMKNDKWFFENGFPYRGSKPDPAHFDWPQCLPTITDKVVEYIETFSGARKDTAFRIKRDQPFFIYFDPHVPHEPIVPTSDYHGKSQAGDYGDFVVELDDAIGKILNTLDKYGLKDNTLVILSSDNGPESTAYKRIQEYNHYSMGELRGVKRDIWEGGHRVPFIARWPHKIKAGSVCYEPIGLIDMFSTISKLTGSTPPKESGGDSFNILPALLGEKYTTPLREPLIYHSLDRRFAIRDGNWVFINAPTGMTSKEPEWFRKQRGVKEHNLQVELFNLKEDPEQLNNVALQYPEKVKELKNRLNMIMERNDNGK